MCDVKRSDAVVLNQRSPSNYVRMIINELWELNCVAIDLCHMQIVPCKCNRVQRGPGSPLLHIEKYGVRL